MNREDWLVVKLYLVRHGETDWNRIYKMQGMTDIPLNDAGRAQAAALGRRFRDVMLAAVFSSDLSRARETAEAIAAQSGAELFGDSRLREQCMGDWEGLTWENVKRDFAHILPTREDADFRPPGGETKREVYDRTAAALRDAMSHGGDVAVVSHGASIRMMLCYLTGAPIEDNNSFLIGNTCVYCLEGSEGSKGRGWEITVRNDVSHLEDCAEGDD